MTGGGMRGKTDEPDDASSWPRSERPMPEDEGRVPPA